MNAILRKWNVSRTSVHLSLVNIVIYYFHFTWKYQHSKTRATCFLSFRNVDVESQYFKRCIQNTRIQNNIKRREIK